jgi:protein SCO1
VLLTQDAERVRFFSDVLRDRVVLLSFMYSHCRLACPLLCQRLNQVREALGDRFQDVRFVTLSVDPERDTPRDLKQFAERQRARYDNWLFLTGGKAEVKAVLSKLGQWVDDPDDHTTAFIAGNTRTNHWMMVRPDAPPPIVAEQIRGLLAENTAATAVLGEAERAAP